MDQRYDPWPAHGLHPPKVTGQYSYMDDPTTTGATEGFGLMFYNARWYDPQLGRFAQADTIVPGGFQGLDRYAYVDNNPIRYTDPTGHFSEDEIEKYLRKTYGKKWNSYRDAWRSDKTYWNMLLGANFGDRLSAPTAEYLGVGFFYENGDTFGFMNDKGVDTLCKFQGYGPYQLNGDGPAQNVTASGIVSTDPNHPGGQTWSSPLYHYTEDGPIYSGFHREVSYSQSSPVSFDPINASDNVPYVISTAIGLAIAPMAPVAGWTWTGISAVSYLNNTVQFHYALSVTYDDRRTYLSAPTAQIQLPSVFIGPNKNP